MQFQNENKKDKAIIIKLKLNRINFKGRYFMLKGKTAIVTGETRGIGFVIVKKYLQYGAKVALFGSKKETVERAIHQLKAENENLIEDNA